MTEPNENTNTCGDCGEELDLHCDSCGECNCSGECEDEDEDEDEDEESSKSD